MFGYSNKGIKGHVTIVDPDAIEPLIERDTMQCVHCGMHWILQPGSGTIRGFCVRCNGATCGSQKCDPCVPFEAKVEIIEGSRSPFANAYMDEFMRITNGKVGW